MQIVDPVILSGGAYAFNFQSRRKSRRNAKEDIDNVMLSILQTTWIFLTKLKGLITNKHKETKLTRLKHAKQILKISYCSSLS